MNCSFLQSRTVDAAQGSAELVPDSARECRTCAGQLPEQDPWVWRELIARSKEVAYGKFFNKKSGFISKAWFPVFANYRRDGYDFDACWDDELANIRCKKIMDCFRNSPNT